MKKKLTRALIDEIRKEMPILSEEEMRYCSGGDGGTVSWDCLFNCMNAMDPSKSAQEYAQEYEDIYGLDPKAMGGVPNQLVGNVLWNLGFNNTPTNSLINDRGYEQVITIVNPDGTAHAVIAISIPTENGEIIYKDPTLGVDYARVKASDIVGIYRIKKSEIDTSIGAHYEGNGYSEYSNYSGDYNQNCDYNDYGYNESGWSRYSNYSYLNI